jgi:hypothetical protein
MLRHTWVFMQGRVLHHLELGFPPSAFERSCSGQKLQVVPIPLMG